jgi:hypothetical protein
MEFFDDAMYEIREFLHKNTKITVTVVSILLALTIFALFAGAFSGKNSAKKKDDMIFPDAIPYSAVQDFFPPRNSSLTEEYYFSREQTSSWSQEEFDRWFSLPTKESVEKLGKSNEKITEEILGAAP